MATESKTRTHTWHQVKTVVWAEGYYEVAMNDDLIICRSGSGTKTITFQKSNNLGNAFILAICSQLGISYKRFVEIYTKEYRKSGH